MAKELKTELKPLLKDALDKGGWTLVDKANQTERWIRKLDPIQVESYLIWPPSAGMKQYRFEYTRPGFKITSTDVIETLCARVVKGR